MTPHDRITAFLARRAELTTAEEAQVQAHLKECAQCEATANAYARQTVLLRALPEVPPPPALRAGVLAGMAQPRALPFWAKLRPAIVITPMLAALVIVVAAVALLHQSHGQSRTAIGPQSSPVPTAPRSNTDQPIRPTAGTGFGLATTRPKPNAHHPTPSGRAQPTAPANTAGFSGTQIAALPPTPVPSPYTAIVAATPGPGILPTSHPAPAACPLSCSSRHHSRHPRPVPSAVAAPVRTAVPSPAASLFGTPVSVTPSPTPSVPPATAVNTPPVVSLVTPHPTLAAPVTQISPTPSPPAPVAPPTPGIVGPTTNPATATPTPSPTP